MDLIEGECELLLTNNIIHRNNRRIHNNYDSMITEIERIDDSDNKSIRNLLFISVLISIYRNLMEKYLKLSIFFIAYLLYTFKNLYFSSFYLLIQFDCIANTEVMAQQFYYFKNNNDVRAINKLL